MCIREPEAFFRYNCYYFTKNNSCNSEIILTRFADGVIVRGNHTDNHPAGTARELRTLQDNVGRH